MRINWQRLVVVTLLALLPAAVAFPWASVYPAEPTHQYIIDTVWNRLQADPAFAANQFPNIYAIKDHEGVEFGLQGELTGKGADAHGMSTYSEHYYNPEIKEVKKGDAGRAPTSVERYYSVLIRDNLLNFNSKSAEAGPKGAAYSAHFLADVCVPYHVNGTTRANAEKIWKDQHAGNYITPDVINRVGVTAMHPLVPLITLPETITGSQVLSYLTPIKGEDRNFYPELSRFLVLTEPKEFDWFDPWYYNGDTNIGGLYYVQSSHIFWEGRPTGELSASAFHQRTGQGLPGYDTDWKNATPTFEKSPWGSQSEQARQFAIAKATETRNRQSEFFQDPTLALGRTIRAVYTLWRGSISGLRPVIEFQPDGATTAYRVTGKVSNEASAAATGVRGQLSATDCTVTDAKEKLMGASLAAGKKQEVSAVWRVQPKADTTCKLRLEVVGAYSIPDLQYALVERTFVPEHVEPVSKPKPPEQPTSPSSATSAGGHWQRGAVIAKWANSPPTSHEDGGKRLRQLGSMPHAGDSWVWEGGGGTWITHTLETISGGHEVHSTAVAGHPDMNGRSEVSWTEPPVELSPGQMVVIKTQGASCYAYTREENNNEHLVYATGNQQNGTYAPYKVPAPAVSSDASKAVFGFFCGATLRYTYAYHWVGR